MTNSLDVNTLTLTYINTVDNINKLNNNIRDIRYNINNINKTVDFLLSKYNIKNMEELDDYIEKIDSLLRINN
tara:strand:- start:63 stop:281 length:219 start_codon:yes stop_codon:yes gene_type:complete